MRVSAFFPLRICTGVILALGLWVGLGGPHATGDGKPQEEEGKSARPSEADGLPKILLEGEFSLPEEKQRFLWDVEHLAFVLIQDIIPIFRSAIEDGRAERLMDLFASEFRGRLPEEEGAEDRHGIVTVRRGVLESDSSTDLDGKAFVGGLISYGRAFSKIQAIKVHVIVLPPGERALTPSSRL